MRSAFRRHDGAMPTDGVDRSPGWTARVAGAALGFLGVTGVLLGVSAQPGADGSSAPSAVPMALHPPIAAAAGVRELTLTAQEVDWELSPGTTVKAWTFNGTIPGPEIRVTEGDLVRITLKNDLPVPTTAHWHGIDVPMAMDGVPGLTQDAVTPGGTFVYEFPATNPGTRWYHSHQDAELQVPLGLYGSVIVEPKTPEPVKYDREYTYVLSEWDLDLTPAVARGDESLPRPRSDVPLSKQLDYDLFVLNGEATESAPPITVEQGERVRLRLINAGNMLHTIRFNGHRFRVVATDGNPVPPGLQLAEDSVMLGPSERADLELQGADLSERTFQARIEHHMPNGMTVSLRSEGTATPVVSAEGRVGHPTH